MSPQDCCSLACNNGGTCGGELCLTNNSMCNSDADCCSSHCHMNRCTIAQDERCLPTGEACDPEAGSHCCSGDCDESGRCDFGHGPCLDPSSPCGDTEATCCGGSARCTLNAFGALMCESTCLVDGATCNTNGDCCGGTCTATSVCSSLPACE